MSPDRVSSQQLPVKCSCELMNINPSSLIERKSVAYAVLKWAFNVIVVYGR